ncbi:MAG TPA: hypothetical protein ENN19_17775 [Chloroflexi bacterium]|nr:hypothetical protein [Chloroflexota bacterium]
MNKPLRITVAFLGLYAGMLGIQHGIFEMLQGNTAPDGRLFNAIGPPCQTEAAWHACFPAMSLIPNLLVTGIVAVIVGLAFMLWALFFIQRRHGGWVLGLLAVVLLLLGGGFMPLFISLIAAGASHSLHHPVARPRFAALASVWPWPLVIMAAWMPGSWLVGALFPEAMLAVGGLFFLVFDVGLAVLAAVSGFRFDISCRSSSPC